MKRFDSRVCKSFLPLFFCFIFLASCQKNLDFPKDDTTVNTTSQIISLIAQDSHYIHTTEYSYDDSKRLSGIKNTTFDTANAVPTIVADSERYVFSYNSTDTVPVSYTWQYGSDAPITHQLYYDGNNRIVNDSTKKGHRSRDIRKFKYGSGVITLQGYDVVDTGVVLSAKDTFFYATNGNMTESRESFYGLDNPNRLVVNYNYSGYNNPLYNQRVATTIGPLLSSFYGHDFVSPKLFSAVIIVQPGQTPDSTPYTWSTDSNGRVLKGIEPSNQFYYLFRYTN